LYISNILSVSTLCQDIYRILYTWWAN